MKKTILILLCAVMTLIMCSCNNVVNVTDDSNNVSPVYHTDAGKENMTEMESVTNSEKSSVTKSEIELQTEPEELFIGGGAFDFLNSDYKYIYCGLDQGALYKIIGVERAIDMFHGPYYDDKQREFPIDGSGIFCRPTLLWYMASKGLLNRDELRAVVEYNSKNSEYNSKNFDIGIFRETFTEEDIDALLREDWKAAMPYLKSPYSFLYDDKLYTVYALYDMKDSEEFAVFVKDDTYKDVWNAIKAFIEEYKKLPERYRAIVYDPDLVDFIYKYSD